MGIVCVVTGSDLPVTPQRLQPAASQLGRTPKLAIGSSCGDGIHRQVPESFWSRRASSRPKRAVPLRKDRYVVASAPG